ncbi:MAG: hypothetical protein JJ902_00475 [Roseibium sp.]|nr:hypothetical protein [Roseibium sp.]
MPDPKTPPKHRSSGARKTPRSHGFLSHGLAGRDTQGPGDQTHHKSRGSRSAIASGPDGPKSLAQKPIVKPYRARDEQ